LLIICLYVDDLLVIRSNYKEIVKFKKTMAAEFEMIDLGELSYLLGMEFTRTFAGLVIHQNKYVGEILKKFNMVSYNGVSNPIKIVKLWMKRCSSKSLVPYDIFETIDQTYHLELD